MIIDKLCTAWKEGQYSGDFCEILCTENQRNWTMVDYIESSNKRIFKLHNGGKDIILKAI